MRAPAAFDSVVLAAVVRDLRPWIGARLRRVLQPAAREIALELRGRGGTVVLCSVDARWARIHLSDPVPGGELSPFAQMLRARLEGARLLALEQLPFERSLTLRFGSDAGAADLIAEVMGRHSNVFLVQDGVVAGALRPARTNRSSARDVHPGRPFVPPPVTRPAPTDLDPARLRGLLAGADAPLDETLSARVLGLGPVMARELAVRAGLDPSAPAAGQAHAVEALHCAILDLVAIVRAEAFQPVVYLDDGTPVGYAPFPLEHLAARPSIGVATMSAAIVRVIGASSRRAELDEQKRALSATVRTALAKAERAEGDLARALEEAADEGLLRTRGELLLAYASQIAAGSTEATLPGFDGTPVTVPLDPHLTPVENAQHLFTRYAKVRSARPRLLARRGALEEERHYLESTLALVEAAEDLDDLSALRSELTEEGVLHSARGGRAESRRRPAGAHHKESRRPEIRRTAPGPAPRTFHLEDGASIIAGRSNRDNDRITFTVAGPDDLWFHARGLPGAHVILRTGGKPATEAQIQAAAEVAAYCSRGRGSGRVDVDYTERRNVRKPGGSRPGLVLITRERTLAVVPRLPQ